MHPGGAVQTVAVSLSSNAGVSGWDLKSFNMNDQVEVALARSLRESAAAHVASLTTAAYRGPWAHVVTWYASLVIPHCPLPADEITVALYL